MGNPFAETAAEILGHATKIKSDQETAKAAEHLKTVAEEDSFKTAVELFKQMNTRVLEWADLANRAFGTEEVVLKVKTTPLTKKEIGAITVSMESGGKFVKSFRFVGNSNFKVYIHDINEPAYSGLSLSDVDTFPYEEAFGLFMKQASEILKSRAEPTSAS
ncbi:hypothetical protein H4S14_002460 [Agrobacterium vitis]|nr:hypothetical protein [Agrobacterium vitis]MBE1438704.1 hypothetical protein [Agrobacterium vitis]